MTLSIFSCFINLIFFSGSTFKLKLFLPFIIGLVFFPQIPLLAKPSSIPFGDFKVRALKRRESHIQTAAMLCALQENGAEIITIQAAWTDKLQLPITDDDQFLVMSIMQDLCPKTKPQKFHF